MTEIIIIEKLSRWLDDRKYPFQICNAFIYEWESDYWAMTTNGETREFEIKISRSDFFTDRKKDKHSNPFKGANFFYYVTPKGLIKPEEVAQNYGLIYVGDMGVEVVKKPRRLNSLPFDNWKMLANKMYWRFRQLWLEKYQKKEIDSKKFREGFNLSLEEWSIELPNVQVSDTTDSQ
jgi:hypothetical protein